MKRDMELVRKILLESQAHAFPGTWRVEVEGYTHDQLSYHVQRLVEAGFIQAVQLANGRTWMIRSLTWDGHEFLDAIQNESVWNEAKERVKEQFVSVPFQVLVPLVLQIFKQQLGLPSD